MVKTNKGFLTGAAVGAAATLLLTNPAVRKRLGNALLGTSSAVKSAGSSVKDGTYKAASSVKETVTTGADIFKDTVEAGKAGFQESVERHRVVETDEVANPEVDETVGAEVGEESETSVASAEPVKKDHE